MATGGYGQGGASGAGPSKMYLSLPWKGWKEVGGWIEEFADSIGYRWDVLNARFLSAASRANLLDPTYTPTDVPSTYLATATAPAVNNTSTDTMVDVLAYIALGLYPLDSNLSVAQKQALAGIGWDALKRKSTRLQLLNLASKITDGIAVGWSAPPNNFSIIIPDGAPSPGYGNWVQSNSSTSEVIRPWILAAVRQVVSKGTPAWINLGVGFSQFRWGYSSWGETWLPAGARINCFTHEHFDSWSAGVPIGWTKSGTGTLTQSTSDTSINYEFTGNAAALDLTAQPSGVSIGLSQSTAVNNQLTHRLQVDYKYTNSQQVGQLQIQVIDVNGNGNTYYWNGSAWSTTATSLVVPVSATRGRYAIDVVPQVASSTGSVQGTSSIGVKVFAISDGTATTQTTYTLYRVGLYEKFNLTVESAALGERLGWWPLVDAKGWTTAARSSGGTLLELANAARSSYKLITAGTQPSFPYHAAISGRGFRSHSSWTNLLKGSNDFGSDWSIVNATKTANAQISPVVGETSPTAPLLTESGTGGTLQQSLSFDASSKSYVGGVWVKKLSSDSNYTDVTVRLAQTTIFDNAFTVKQSEGWKLLPFTATFPAGQTGLPVFAIKWGAASSTGQIAVADAYLYDVTGKPAVLYPPVVRTAVGATASTGATTCTVTTAGANVFHPLTQRTMVSVVRGALGLTVIPTFDASSQPNGVIFDTAQGAAQNRVLLRVNSGALELHRWDNAGNQWTASLTLTVNPNPAAGSMTWLRNTAIVIQAAWDENTTSLGAGNGNNFGTKPGSWAPSDASVANPPTIGCDYAGANPFDGSIKGTESLLRGATI